MTHLDRIVQDDLEDRLRRVRHEDAALELGLLCQVGHGAAVIHVEVGDEQKVDGREVGSIVEKGQRTEAL